MGDVSKIGCMMCGVGIDFKGSFPEV